MLLDANTQWVLISTLLLGIASGVLGSFAYLRKQSLIGDAVAHASLPGIALAFLLIGEKNLLFLIIGATVTGLLATYLIQKITLYSRLKEDTAIALILSVFFGMGILLLTKIAQTPSGNKSGLDSFIFGKAASLVGTDVIVMTSTAFSIVVVTLLLFKELKVATFDPAFAKGIGLPVGFLNFLFLSLLVLTVVVGIQAVGVILMAALLITPALAARYWTDSLEIMVSISGAIGAVSGVMGTLISTLRTGLPTGPFIVLTATTLFVISMLFAPKRGLIAKRVRRQENDKRLLKESLLVFLYSLSREQVSALSYQDASSSFYMKGKAFNKLVALLEEEQWIVTTLDMIMLTEEGKQTAEKLKIIQTLEQLQEMYPNEFMKVESREQLIEKNFQSLQQMVKKVKASYPFMKAE
ncbi:metal ABC transporter permease [Massilibacterium senegalense]|uniref:metal ABC transporter permease n=1 Tax=Massilibacterium senegalense TaxID=1632858 RepID=UPI00093BA900|nr:metal ABC transporter permease [Massilibacterium senegalense]